MFWELEKRCGQTPKPPEMPLKQGKTSQHHNRPRCMDCPQIGPKNATKLVKIRQKDKWYLLRAPTPPPLEPNVTFIRTPPPAFTRVPAKVSRIQQSFGEGALVYGSPVERAQLNKQIWGIVPRLGGKILLMCFRGHFFGEEGGVAKKHRLLNRIPRKSRDKPVRTLSICFFFGGVFRSQKMKLCL